MHLFDDEVIVIQYLYQRCSISLKSILIFVLGMSYFQRDDEQVFLHKTHLIGHAFLFPPHNLPVVIKMWLLLGKPQHGACVI